MSDTRSGAFSLVLIPALLTLIVTGVRLVGELQGWDPKFFSTQAGGGSAVVGITWLIFVFGFWFGWRLRRSGAPFKGRAAVIYLAGILVPAAAGYGLFEAGLISFPTRESPALVGLPYLLVLMGVGALFALVAWPRLTGTLMLYGVLARVPVIVVTYLDLHFDWQTHYGELPPGAAPSEPLLALCLPQATLWPFFFTPLAGGLLGCLGAALTGPKRG